MADMVMSQVTDDVRAWAVRLSREGGEYDRLARLAAAEERGEKRGLKKGRSEGLSQGRSEGIALGSHAAKLEFARTMLACGESLDKIQKYTNLSLLEIQSL